MVDKDLTEQLTAVQVAAHPLLGISHDYDALLELVGDATIVLLGEASHGSHEFYQARAQITQRLIEEKGFTAVAVEADWPDANRVNCYVRGIGDDYNTVEALGDFKRFPAWMWRNQDVVAFISWLHDYNAAQGSDAPMVGFYGLDLYSMYASIAEVLAYLDKNDAAAAQQARQRYACLEHFGENSQAYGYAASFGLGKPCADAVVEQLVALQQHKAAYMSRDGQVAEDAYFYAEQNARLVKNAEEYYRSMFASSVYSWNLRDQHMAGTLDVLIANLGRGGRRAKVVVWEHNSHIGDARATQMGVSGELNVGQLARERYGEAVRLVGFSTYQGSVTAASEWDGPAERKRVRPALAGSYEELFHSIAIPNFFLSNRREIKASNVLRDPRLERAIGVIYRPDTERVSHYFYARLPEQFDAVIHFDQTTAVTPLERTAQWESLEPAETYPTGV